MLTRKRKYDDETPKHLKEKQGGLEALEQMKGTKKLRAATGNDNKKRERNPHTRRAHRSASSSEERTMTRKKRHQVVETTSSEESSTDSSRKRRKVHSQRDKKSMAALTAHKSSFTPPKAVLTTKKASSAVPNQISPHSLPQTVAAAAVRSSLKSATLLVVSPLSSPQPAPETAVVAVSSLKSAPKAASPYTHRMQAVAIESDDEDLRDDDGYYCSRSDSQAERRDDNVILEEPPVVVDRQPRSMGGWWAAIAVLLSMMISQFFSEPSLVVVKQWCAVQAPELVFPSFTNSVSKEQSCLSKYRATARTRDACISRTVPNETIAGITDKLRDWTIQYICSAGSIPNITPVSTTGDRPLFVGHDPVRNEELNKQTNLKPRTKGKEIKDLVVTDQQGKDTAVAVHLSRGVKLSLVGRIRLLIRGSLPAPC